MVITLNVFEAGSSATGAEIGTVEVRQEPVVEVLGFGFPFRTRPQWR
jgi:hypothetical protein